MADFRTGDKVHVEFDGVVTSRYEGGWLVIEDGGSWYRHQIWATGAEKVVTRLEPKNWPPQPGDIWAVAGAAEDQEWFARTATFGRVVLDGAETGSQVHYGYSSEFGFDKFKALNPRLVRRRGCR
jgi:hypothetical protein